MLGSESGLVVRVKLAGVAVAVGAPGEQTIRTVGCAGCSRYWSWGCLLGGIWHIYIPAMGPKCEPSDSPGSNPIFSLPQCSHRTY